MQYLIYCDFASINCDKFEFAKKLDFPGSTFQNINDDIWLLELPDHDEGSMGNIPYAETASDILRDLQSTFATDSTIIVCAVSDWAGSISGNPLMPINKMPSSSV